MWIVFETPGALDFIASATLLHETGDIRVYEHNTYGPVMYTIIKFEDEKYFIYETDFWALEHAKNEIY